MKSMKRLFFIALFSFCISIGSKSYGQVTTAAEWERIRKDREMREARNREAARLQEQALKNVGFKNNDGSSGGTPGDDMVYEYIDKTADENGLKIMKRGGYFGLTDSKKEVVFPDYDYIKPFTGGFYCIKGSVPDNEYSKKIGFMDATGKIVIPLQYDLLISNFQNGHATVVLNNERFQIDKTGAVVGTKTVHEIPKTQTEVQNEARTRIDKNFLAGIESYERGDLSDALKTFQWVESDCRLYEIKLDAARIDELNFYMIMSRFNLGVFSDYEVRSLCRELVTYAEKGGKNPEMYYYIGYLLIEKKDATQALTGDLKKSFGIMTGIAFLLKYIQLESPLKTEKTNTFRLLGDAYLENKDTANGLVSYQKELELLSAKKHAPPRYEVNNIVQQMVYTYIYQDKISELISFLPAAKAFPAPQSYGYTMAAAALANKALYEEALNAVSLGINIARENNVEFPYGCFDLRGCLNYRLNKKSEAMEDFKQSIASEITNPDSYYFRGMLYNEQGKRDEACADWTKARKKLDNHRGRFVSMSDVDNACKQCSKKQLRTDE